MSRYSSSINDSTDPRYVGVCPGCFKDVSNRAYWAGRMGILFNNPPMS